MRDGDAIGAFWEVPFYALLCVYRCVHVQLAYAFPFPPICLLPCICSSLFPLPYSRSAPHTGFCENTTGAPCTKVEGLITLHLYENANEASVSDSSQMAIELVMDAGDLNGAHPEIVDVSYIGAGPTIPVADNIKLGPEKAEGPTGSQGSGSNTLAIAVGSSAGLLGLALIGLGVKMRRDKEDLEELEDEGLDPQDVDEMDSAKEVALDGQTAYDMHKLNIPTDETFGSTTMPVDGSTTAVGDDTTLHESRFMEQSNASRIMASLDEVDEYGEDVNTSVASGHGSNISVGHSNTVDLV